MKAYLLDIPNKYHRFSKNLDVKAILCNKSWLVFNDSEDKELYNIAMHILGEKRVLSLKELNNII